MFYLGLDLGGTGIKAGLVTDQGEIIHKDSVPTGAQRDYKEIVKDMAELCIKVVNDAGKSMDEVAWVGIGSPGTCDVENGVLIYTNNINFRNAPLRSEMQKYINKEIFLDNDANCAALGESISGAAKGTKHAIAITLGTGLGGGIIIDGKVYGGFNYSGGELGHMVICVDGEPCTCGRKGCWESYSSATGLVRITREIANKNKDSLIWKLANGDIEKIGGKTGFDAAKAGDKAGQEVVDTYIKYLGEGLVNIINIFQPEKLVIGGGVCNEGEYLLKPLREHVESQRYSRDIKQTEIIVAELGNDAGIIGAAMLGK